MITLLTRCLEKDPKRRVRDIGVSRFGLEETAAGEPEEPRATLAVTVGGHGARIMRGIVVWRRTALPIFAIQAALCAVLRADRALSTPKNQDPPTEWIEPATGHRVAYGVSHVYAVEVSQR